MQAGLGALLATDAAVEVVDATQATVQQVLPDVVLLEEGQTDDLMALLDSAAVVMLLEDWQNAVPLLQLGVQGILPHSVSSEELLAALKAAATGLCVIHPDLLETVMTGTVAQPIPQLLTEREREVLNCIAAGMGNKAIAKQLTISEHTVKFHISSIFSKLHVSSRTEAVIFGARQGWFLV
jgi:DNA-binding NarL/FixJ family response regulator